MLGKDQFNSIMESKIDHAGGETQTTAQNSLQAEAPQELSAPVSTAESTTPTLHFGEVGTTTQTETTGYESKAHSVGHFTDTKLLERSVLVGAFDWAVADLNGSLLLKTELHSFLRDFPRNKVLMDQFDLYRGDMEVTVRLNTNQFYYGALMINLYPSNKTGQFIEEAAVLDPTILTASSAESVIKTWNYSYPFSWLRRPNISTTPVYLTIWVLGNLQRAKDDMPDTITVSVWARWKNIQLAYPHYIEAGEAQAGRGKLSVHMPQIGGVRAPAESPGAGLNKATKQLTGIASSAIDDVGMAAGGLADMVFGGLGNVLGFLDKPDNVDHQSPMIVEAAKDLFCADIADTNVSVSMYKSRYVDPDVARLPMTKTWTLSDYARIPGLRFFTTFTAKGQNAIFSPMLSAGTVNNRIPLDYAFQCSQWWRGSTKICLQFFTSTFISARFVVEYINAGLTGPGVFSTDYVNGIAKVINVKGDTTDTFTLPWLDYNMWTDQALNQFRVSVVSDVASTDTLVTPTIQLAIWVSGGDDIQFAWPRAPTYEEWPWRDQNTAPVPKFTMEGQAQSAMGAIFQEKFPPLVDNCFYDVDQGYATGEQIGPMSDVAKRYSVFQTITGFQDHVGDDMMDLAPDFPVATQEWNEHAAWRATFFGAMRACFLYRSGGYRYRHYEDSADGRSSYLVLPGSNSLVPKTNFLNRYTSPYDQTSRLTVPQTLLNSFAYLGQRETRQLRLGGSGVPKSADLTPTYFAARDDVQFGYPILPRGVPEPVELPPPLTGRLKLTSTRGKLKASKPD